MGARTVAGVGLVTLLALAGCGGDDDTTVAPEATTGATVDAGPPVDAEAEDFEAPASAEDVDNALVSDDLIAQEATLFEEWLNTPAGSQEEAAVEAELDELYEPLEEQYGDIEELIENDNVPEELEVLAMVQYVRNLGTDPFEDIPDDAPIHDMESEEDIMRYMLDCDDDVSIEECEAGYEESVNEDMIEYDLEACRETVAEGPGLMSCFSTVLPDEEFWALYEDTYGEPLPDEFR